MICYARQAALKRANELAELTEGESLPIHPQQAWGRL